MSYLKFILKSTNAHGVHSPFIYALVSEGFYYGRKVKNNNGKGLSSQALTTLFKTINHFSSFKLMVMGENEAEVTESIREAGEKTKTKIWLFSPLAPIPGGPDLCVISGHNTQTVLPVFNSLLKHVNDHTFFALPNVHATPEMEQAWETIKKDPNVTVTVDTYHLGLIFFRKGQAKQHFTIRPYKSILLDFVLGIPKLWGMIP